MTNENIKVQTNAGVIDTGVVGTRYPVTGFFTSGAGASDKGWAPQPYETFSYDLALKAAMIENFNIVPYTSVLPPELEIIPVAAAKKYFHHGAVLEIIYAMIGITYSTSPKKSNIGIHTHGHNYDLDSNETVMAAATCIGILQNVLDPAGQNVGGYVAEYTGVFDKHVGLAAAQQQADDQLNQSLDHILQIRGFQGGIRSIRPVSYVEVSEQQRFGSTLNGMGFINFKHATPYPSIATASSSLS